MADVMAWSERPTPEQIAGELDYLLGEWGGLDEVATEWDDMDAGERLTFDVEWGLREDRLARMVGWAGAGLLGEAQLARYRELQALVAAGRPILARLRG